MLGSCHWCVFLSPIRHFITKRELVNPQASTNLNASINAANASYNTTQAVTAYLTSGRNENI